MYIEQVLGNILIADNTDLSITQNAVQTEKVQVQYHKLLVVLISLMV